MPRLAHHGTTARALTIRDAPARYCTNLSHNTRTPAPCLPGVVVWRIDRDKVNRGQVLKIIGSDIHKRLTVRNPNTVRKLYALMRADTISP